MASLTCQFSASKRINICDYDASHKGRRIVVSGAKYTDMDGFACAVGMAEFLRRSGLKAIAYLPKKAPMNSTIPDFVLKEWKYISYNDTNEFEFQVGKCIPEKERDVLVIVDTSNPNFVDKNEHTPKILASDTKQESKDVIQVESVIDHHFQRHWIEKWQCFPPFIHPQIEEVASCATLITKKFWNKGWYPSQSTARLLLLAIWSNSLNFQLKSLTKKVDIDMAQYLSQGLQMNTKSEELRRRLFVETSRSAVERPVEAIMDDTKYLTHMKAFPKEECFIGQLEIQAMPQPLNRDETILWVLKVYQDVKKKMKAPGGELYSSKRNNFSPFLINFVIVEHSSSFIVGDKREFLEFLKKGFGGQLDKYSAIDSIETDILLLQTPELQLRKQIQKRMDDTVINRTKAIYTDTTRGSIKMISLVVDGITKN